MYTTLQSYRKVSLPHTHTHIHLFPLILFFFNIQSQITVKPSQDLIMLYKIDAMLIVSFHKTVRGETPQSHNCRCQERAWSTERTLRCTWAEWGNTQLRTWLVTEDAGHSLRTLAQVTAVHVAQTSVLAHIARQRSAHLAWRTARHGIMRE